MKLISTTGVIASKSNCPTAGESLGTSCSVYTVPAVDASGTVWQVSVELHTYTDGNCGTYSESGHPEHGVCGFPPYGWATEFSPQYIYIPDIAWSHPANPQVGQTAHPPTQYLESYGITTVTGWPQTYQTGWQLSVGQEITTVYGQDGWRLIIYYSGNGQWSATENDLTP